MACLLSIQNEIQAVCFQTTKKCAKSQEKKFGIEIRQSKSEKLSEIIGFKLVPRERYLFKSLTSQKRSKCGNSTLFDPGCLCSSTILVRFSAFEIYWAIRRFTDACLCKHLSFGSEVKRVPMAFLKIR